jgi:hypothetical protein
MPDPAARPAEVRRGIAHSRTEGRRPTAGDTPNTGDEATSAAKAVI